MRSAISVGGWLRLSIRKRFSAFVAVAAVVGVPMAVLCALIVPLVQASDAASAQIQGGSVLTQISVTRPDGSQHENLLEPELSRIESLSGVISVIPEDAATLYSCDCGGGASWGATVLAIDPAALPEGVSPEAALSLSGNRVIVPASISGDDLTRWVGRTMPATYSHMVDAHTGESRDISVVVVASYPDSWSAPYPDTVFAGKDLVVRLLAAERGVPESEFLAREGFSRVIVNVESTSAVDEVTDEIRRQGLDAFPLRDRLGALPDTIGMVPVLAAWVALATLGSATIFVVVAVRRAVRKRQREFGLLRLRGWKRATVVRLIALDAGLGAVAGASFGALVGLSGGIAMASALLGASLLQPRTVLVIASIWAGVLVISTGTAVVSAWVGLRRDPFIAIMAPD